MGSIVLKIHARMPQTSTQLSPDQLSIENQEIQTKFRRLLRSQYANPHMKIKGIQSASRGSNSFVAFRATFESEFLKSISDFDLTLMEITSDLKQTFGLTIERYDLFNPAIEIGFQDRIIIGDFL